MNLKIGVKIKHLRKRKDVTQEKLAEALGVTSQAISRWESGNGYPDIEYIMPIANYFNVTTDFLFDHDTTGKRKKIDTFCKEYDSNRGGGNPFHRLHKERKPANEQTNMMRQALAEFPGDERLLFRLADSLYLQWCDYHLKGHDEHGNATQNIETERVRDGCEEFTKILSELASASADDALRSKCRELLADFYGRRGENDKVIAIAEKCDSILNCKENILTLHITGGDHRKYAQQLLISSLALFHSALLHMASGGKNPHYDVQIINTIINVYEFIFSDGNLGANHGIVSNLSLYGAIRLMSIDMYDEALTALEQALFHARKYDTILAELTERGGEIQYTAPAVDKIAFSIKDMLFTAQAQETTKYVKGNELFSKLFNSPRFIALFQ